MLKVPKVIWFIVGPLPSPDDKIGALEIAGAQVVFRNATEVPNYPHALETCDGVAGAVPKAYFECPSAADAVSKYRRGLEKLQQVASDEAAKVKAPTLPDGVAPPAAPWKSNS